MFTAATTIKLSIIISQVSSFEIPGFLKDRSVRFGFYFVTLAFVAFFRFIIFSPLVFLLVYTFLYLSFSVLLASSRQGERILLFYRSIYLGSLRFDF